MMFRLLTFKCVLVMLILHLVVTNIIIVYFIYCIHVVVLLYGKYDREYDVTHITEMLSLSRHHLKIDNVK